MLPAVGQQVSNTNQANLALRRDSLIALFVSKRHEGVDFGRTAGGDVAGE
jgi:hypothetical protein